MDLDSFADRVDELAERCNASRKNVAVVLLRKALELDPALSVTLTVRPAPGAGTPPSSSIIEQVLASPYEPVPRREPPPAPPPLEDPLPEARP